MALNDDYLSCKSYEGHEVDPKNEGFTLFQDKKSEKYFFAYSGKSKDVLLRSEGYIDASSRAKGIASIKKNISELSRFSVIEEAGKFFIILKAGNNKEIGRSCDFKTKAAADKGLENFGLKTESKTKKALPTPKKETVLNTEISPKKETTTKKETATKKEAVIKVTEVSKSDSILTDLSGFLEISEYLDRARIWDSYGITGYVKFQAQDGNHYFGVYNPDATLYLRSQGFATEEDRDAVFDVMDSTILLEENYKIENLNGRYYAILFEENDVVAISPDFGSFIEAFVTTPGGRPREVQGTMF